MWYGSDSFLKTKIDHEDKTYASILFIFKYFINCISSFQVHLFVLFLTINLQCLLQIVFMFF